MHCLRVTIRRCGESVASVERKLGRGRGYVGDALRGSKVLTVDLIVEVLEALELDVPSFFAWAVRTAWPPRRSPSDPP